MKKLTLLLGSVLLSMFLFACSDEEVKNSSEKEEVKTEGKVSKEEKGIVLKDEKVVKVIKKEQMLDAEIVTEGNGDGDGLYVTPLSYTTYKEISNNKGTSKAKEGNVFVTLEMLFENKGTTAKTLMGIFIDGHPRLEFENGYLFESTIEASLATDNFKKIKANKEDVLNIIEPINPLQKGKVYITFEINEELLNKENFTLRIDNSGPFVTEEELHDVAKFVKE